MIPGIIPASAVADGGMERIARIADPQRAQRLDAYERLYKSRAYEGRPSFWDATVPLHERAPAVCVGVAEAAGGRLAAMVFGQRVFPNLRVADGEIEVALSDVERDQLSQLVTRLAKVADLRLCALSALIDGLSVGTVVVHASVVRGRPTLTLLPAKWCTPEFDSNDDLRSVEIRYRFDAPDSRSVASTWWYRRVIDAERDVTYRPMPVRVDGRDPVWVEETVVDHGLGFCPVDWHRNRPETTDNGIDGTPLFAGLEAEIEGLDMAFSQRHRNGRYNGEPQMVVVGADTERPLGDTGRTAQPIPEGKASFFSSIKDAAGRWFTSGGSASATKKAPNKIWRIPEGGSATLLESTGAGANILAADIEGLRRAILEARGIVIVSPETVGANASAALMREIYAPMIAVADTYRDEYGAWLTRIVSMLLRVCWVAAARPGSLVLLRGLAAALPLLSRFEIAPEGGREWLGLPLDLKWGPYFPPMPSDIAQTVSAASLAAGGAQVLSHRSAVAMVAAVADIDDVDAELRAITGTQAEDKDVLASLPTDANAAPVDAVADTALNGAQVTSLVEILANVSGGALPIDSAKSLILAAFPSFDDARVESMLAPLRNRAPVLTEPAP